MIHIIIFHYLLLMNSRELRESPVEELMKMSKEDLLKMATSHWNNWIRTSVELEKSYKDEGRVLPKVDKYDEGRK